MKAAKKVEAPELPKAELVLSGADRETWLAERRKGFGGSDIAALMGVGTHSAAEVILDKQGYGVELDQRSPLLVWGQRVEPLILTALREDHEIAVQTLPKEVLYRSVEYPVALASLDGLADQATAGVECKNVSHYVAHEWDDGEVPIHYLAQAQWYLGVTGLAVWHVGALIGGHDLRHVVVNADPELFADMIDVAHKAWEHVENGTLPALDGSDATTRAIKAKFREHVEGKAVEGGTKLASLLIQLEVASSIRKDADERENAVKNEIRALLGDAEIGLIDGEKAVTYRSSHVGEHTVKSQIRRILRPVKRSK